MARSDTSSSDEERRPPQAKPRISRSVQGKHNYKSHVSYILPRLTVILLAVLPHYHSNSRCRLSRRANRAEAQEGEGIHRSMQQHSRSYNLVANADCCTMNNKCTICSSAQAVKERISAGASGMPLTYTMLARCLCYAAHRSFFDFSVFLTAVLGCKHCLQTPSRI